VAHFLVFLLSLPRRPNPPNSQHNPKKELQPTAAADAASDAHAHGGAGGGDASGGWTQHRADPEGAFLFPPSPAVLDRFRVPPWWVLGAGSRLDIRSFSRP
jgi:hypothetical protein